MDFDGVRAALLDARHTSLQAWLTIAVLVAVVYAAAGVGVAALSRRRIGKAHYLTIQTSDETAVDEIWLNRAAMKQLGLRWGDTIRIQGQGPNAYGKPRYAKLRVRRGLEDHEIELSPDLQVLLFSDLPNGGPNRKFAFAPGVRKGGFEEFWFNPNEQLRFQNRLSIYLALGLPLFQMIWTWAFRLFR